MPVNTQSDTPRIDLSRYELTVHGQRVRLERQPMELLIFFAQRPGQLVNRDEIIQKLWGSDVFVDADRGINSAVRKIRSALKDDPAAPKFLETVVGKGYRFTGNLELVQTSSPPAQGEAEPISERPKRRWLRLAFLTGCALVVLTLGIVGAQYQRSRKASPRVHSIAVLPLANLSGDSSEDYLADGITDELITELARIGSLRVISRTSAMRYRDTKVPLPQIAQQLKVDAIVEGSVTRSAGRLRVTAQLIDGASDQHIWADSYERDTRDMLSLQRELAHAIASQVNASLTPDENARLASKHALDPRAHEAYLRGLFFWNKWTEEGVRKSIEYFRQALDIDPNYASAYAAMANSYISLGDFGVGILPPHEANAAAEQAALRAISLDETLAEAHAALAMSRFRCDSDLTGVEPEFRRAIDLSPGSSTPHHWYSHYLLAVGRSQEAIREGELAYDLNPVDPEMSTHLEFLDLFLHRYDKVIERAGASLELDPNFGETYFMRAQAYEQRQMYAEAKRDYLQAKKLSGGRSMILASYGHLLGISGDRIGARQIHSELTALSRQRYVPSYEKGLMDIGLGNREGAMSDLTQAYNEGSHWMFVLQTDARLDPLRSNPRFQELVRRVGRQN